MAPLPVAALFDAPDRLVRSLVNRVDKIPLTRMACPTRKCLFFVVWLERWGGRRNPQGFRWRCFERDAGGENRILSAARVNRNYENFVRAPREPARCLASGSEASVQTGFAAMVGAGRFGSSGSKPGSLY